jgi:hypothetical protein
VAAHDLGAAAQAIRAVGASASAGETEAARIRERESQRERLPAEVRELALDDQRSRSPICWNDSTTDIGPFVASHSDRDRSQQRARKPTAKRHVASAVCGKGLAPESWAESNKCGQERIADAEA